MDPNISSPQVSPPPQSPFAPSSQKSSLKVIILFVVISLVLLLAGAGGLYYMTQQNGIGTAVPSPTLLVPTPQVSEAVSEVPFQCEKSFASYHEEKYPRPSEQPIPEGLEEQLFAIYSSNRQTDRASFKLRQYYGEVARGTIGEPGSGASTWVMNNVNGQWKVIIPVSKEIPSCNELYSFVNVIQDWQGACYLDDGKVIDSKHPEEPYNKCN